MKIKKWIARLLRPLSNGLYDIGYYADKLADRLEEVDQSEYDHIVESIWTSLEARHANPCPRCDGKGAVPVSAGTDWVGCEACQGTGIALEADKST